MRGSFVSVLTGLTILSAPCISLADAAGGYRLAEKDKSFATGTKRKVEVILEFKESKMKLEIGGEMLEGTTSRKETIVHHFETLSEAKERRVVERKVEGATHINGHEEPQKAPRSPLHGVPVIVEKKDGKYTAMLEAGQADPAQAKALAHIAKGLEEKSGDDAAMYGEKPRQPGDKWKVDPKHASDVGEIEGATGTYTVEFRKVEDFEGVPCAVLESEFEVSGHRTEGGGMSMRFKGNSVIHRSLADQVDLRVRTEATLTMEGKAGPQAQVKVEGPFVSDRKTTLTRP